MKHIIIIIGILISISLSSCDEDQGFGGGTDWVKESSITNTYKTVKLDGCEYIYVSVNSGYAGALGLTHKGNCSNPIHKCKCND